MHTEEGLTGRRKVVNLPIEMNATWKLVPDWCRQALTPPQLQKPNVPQPLEITELDERIRTRTDVKVAFLLMPSWNDFLGTLKIEGPLRVGKSDGCLDSPQFLF
jgi:hypothetical protein